MVNKTYVHENRVYKIMKSTCTKAVRVAQNLGKLQSILTKAAGSHRKRPLGPIFKKCTMLFRNELAPKACAYVQCLSLS